MDLQRGVCSLCTENTRVLSTGDAERFCKYLPKILHENFLPESQFQLIKNSLKVCTVCCYKLELANEMKNIISNSADKQTDDKESVCYFCKTDKCLSKIDKNWKYFIDRTEDYVNPNDFPLCACPRCVFYFHTIFIFKTKLTYKFPQLKLAKPKKTEVVQSDTPKRKSSSKSPPSNKKRKIFNNCFTYLQPLCNNNYYHIDEELKTDINLFRRVAYVNLKTDKKVEVKETPKTRPIIKIKLKRKASKHDKEKLSRSEEPPKKDESKTKRRHSHLDQQKSDDAEENINETPKSAIISSIVPKRRVSVYLNSDENEEKSDEKIEEIHDSGSEEVANNCEDDVGEENGSCADLPQEQKEEKPVSNGESVPEIVNGDQLESIEQKEPPVDSNPIEMLDDSTENILDEHLAESITSKDSKDEDSELDFLTLKPTADISKIEIFEKDVTLNTSTKDNSDLDILNGSERKKKRVTFSDDVIE